MLAFFFGFEGLVPRVPSVAPAAGLEGPEGPADAYLPCLPGLSIEYRLTVGGEPRAEVREVVRGRGDEPRLCVIERRTIYAGGAREDTAWAREHLPDRISNAGWAELPVAFRPPLLKAPLEKGRRWHFNRTDFEIAESGGAVTVAAGKFEPVVVVEERASDGPHVARNTYARGVGLILRVRGAERMEASSVHLPDPRRP